MKQFKKVLILKWHYIEHECVDLGDINFLTGKNASGKSTFIDAMQLVLLGDTKGNYFNKAANEKSHRTLSSYVRGELMDSEVGFEYLRNDDFSSVIAIEVYDTDRRKFFVIGIHMDVHNDGSIDHRYFIMEDKLPDNHFIQQDLVMSITELKAWCQSEGIKIDQFPSNKAYRETLLAKLGHINQKYFSLFKKAVPFSPITNIKGFITEFICDTDKKIEIKDMQNNIRYYEKMKLEAEDIERRLEYLDKIHMVYGEYKQLLKNEQIQKFVLAKGREQMSANYIEKLYRDLRKGNEQLAELSLEIRLVEETFDRLTNELNAVNRELATSDEMARKEAYENDIKQLENRIADYSSIKEQIFKKLRQRAGSWVHAGEEALVGLGSVVIAEQLFKSEDLEAIHLDDLKQLNHMMEERIEEWRQLLYECNRFLETMDEEMQVLNVEIDQLKKGMKSIPAGVRRLQDILQNEFGKVPMLCDLIEIKDQKWQQAIEGYLHLQKFYLMVAPEDYEAALKLYEKIKIEEKIYDVGLVDLQKVQAYKKSIKSGSLSEEIITENPLVRAYVDYLLGDVIKVDDVKELRSYRTSITPSCMLYKNFVARNLNPKRYEMPAIGQYALAKQLELKEEKLQQLFVSYEIQKAEQERYENLRRLQPLGADVVEQLNERLQDLCTLPSLMESVFELKTELSKIDMSNVIELTAKQGDLENKRNVEDKKLIDAKAQQKNLSDGMKVLEYKEIPRAINNRDHFQGIIDKNFEISFINDVGLKKYEEAFKRLNSANEIVNNYDSSSKGTENKRNKKWDEVIKTRLEYTRHFMATYDVQQSSNEQYEKLRIQLSETELPHYKEKIDDAIKMAQQEFRDDFLSKLKYNIDIVKDQINELNDALKNMSFGKDAYAFKITPNSYYRKYYDMIMDPNLMSDFNIFSVGFQEKYGDVIEELFKKIIDVGEGAISADERAEIEANITKYTDYRTYLDFDLVVTDLRGNKSHLSKMISKKSGGETQTPFYISVLASFYRVYRMNTKAKDTTRLIIFDEAFSKMDHERIEQCIALLKELGFQALISAPTEKIANISPLVDKTLCVLRTKDTTLIKSFTKKELEELMDE